MLARSEDQASTHWDRKSARSSAPRSLQEADQPFKQVDNLELVRLQSVSQESDPQPEASVTTRRRR
jgi:hypothetical protein